MTSSGFVQHHRSGFRFGKRHTQQSQASASSTCSKRGGRMSWELDVNPRNTEASRSFSGPPRSLPRWSLTLPRDSQNPQGPGLGSRSRAQPQIASADAYLHPCQTIQTKHPNGRATHHNLPQIMAEGKT